jgi:hypothetical protein
MDITSYLLGKNSSGGTTPTYQEKSVTITENGTTSVTADSGYDALNKVNITTNVSGGGSDLDWSALGFSGEPTQVVNTKNQINSDYDYAEEIQDTWVSSTDLGSKYNGNTTISYMPTVDTSAATSMRSMFWGCPNLYGIAPLNTTNVKDMYELCRNCGSLIDFPLIDASKLTSDSKKSGMFTSCNKLSDKSLDNILQMCISMTSLISTATKTLASIGITNTSFYPVSRIEALPHYQDFINAGWTIS